MHSISGGGRSMYLLFGGDQDLEGRSRCDKASIAFTVLKKKIDTTPILKHFDSDRPPVIVVYARK